MKLMVDLNDEVYNNVVIKNEYTNRDIISLRNALMDAMFFQSYPSDHERKFEKIIVRYPPEASCVYPEYKGKPYFSIQYEENGEHIVGFGTYNPDVLSRYLTEYFIIPERMVSKSSGTSQQKNEDIAKAFQFGLGFGFAAKHDEMVRVINEIKKVTKVTRDCKTCGHSKDGKCSYTEECHECMFESKYVKADKEEGR